MGCHSEETALMSMPTRAAIERAQQSVRAAHIFRQHTEDIVGACRAAAAGEIVLAGVTGRLEWGGTIVIPAVDLTGTAPEDNGGSTLVFSPLVAPAQDEERCLRLANCAYKRWEAMRTLAVARGLNTELEGSQS